MVLVKYRLHELIRTFGLERFLPLHWLPPGIPWQKEIYNRSERTRMALEELGTTFIKIGQILSTRTDLLSSDFSQELSKLQNNLTPVPLEAIEKVITGELGKPVKEICATFDPTPVGVASIGQVHAATLLDGTEVVIKVRKPGVAEQVKEDLDILRELAEGSAERAEYAYQYNLQDLVEEIADTITAELDYIQEGRNAEHFAEFFKDDLSMHIPKVFWEYTTSGVIFLERIKGLGCLDLPALDKAGFDRVALSRRAVDIWLKMIFEDTVFHSDPHPGNLFVEADDRLGLVDFGMVGQMDEDVRDNLASTVKAILERDVDLLVDSIIDLGAVGPAGSREKLRADLKRLAGYYPLKGEFHQVPNVGKLLAAVRRNRLQLPSNTFLLLKTMAMAQGLGKAMNPDLNFFDEIKPYVERALKKKFAPSTILRQMPAAAADLALFGVGLPKRMTRIVKQLERGDIRFRTDVSGLELHMEHLERIVRMLVIGLIIAAVIVGAAVLFLAYKI